MSARKDGGNGPIAVTPQMVLAGEHAYHDTWNRVLEDRVIAIFRQMYAVAEKDPLWVDSVTRICQE